MTLTAHEKAVLEGFASGRDPAGDPEAFAMGLALEAARTIRGARLGAMEPVTKADGSPATAIELAIEERMQALLRGRDPAAVLVAEEMGGVLPVSGPSLAVDPIDGTWAFLARTETSSTALALFEGRDIVAAVVVNPATGELVHASPNTPTRLIQLSTFGEPAQGWDLPLASSPPRPLVDAQGGAAVGPILTALFAAWGEKKIGTVKSAGGSPSWGLASAAKGSFTYVNPWRAKAAPYELAPGVLLVRQAGGDVTDLSGRPIDPLDWSGPFVAGIHAEHRAVVASIASQHAAAAGRSTRP
jgi:myo-inositol-1(or 4)-monophosphatase